MKNKSLIILLILSLAGIYLSCTDEALVNNGDPRIRYVRVTNPASSDSLLVAAFQSSTIAIIGNNLASTEQVWFNDKRAVLSPTYVTNESIIVTVPGQIPGEITNKLQLVFSDGKTLSHDFSVSISEPEILSMKSEYVLQGNIATIRGRYFYEPLTVSFTGGVTGELFAVTETEIQVIVPAGALPGPITVTSNFGFGVSNFWFRDTRNIFVSSDPFTGWWNPSFVVTTPGPNDPPKINGNYIRVIRSLTSWNWVEAAGGPPSAMGDISKNIPDAAILRPSDYYFKFEVNTVKPYTNNMIKFNLGLSKDFFNDEYRWVPPYDSKGQWETVTIPLEQVMSKFTSAAVPDGNILSPAGYYTRILIGHGPGDLECDIAFDNLRVVPKVINQ